MEINLAKSAGFCFGVENAVKRVTKELENGELYTYGAIVHNKNVTNELAEKGAKITETTDIYNSKVIFRAHGVGREVHETFLNNGNEVIDCTCPCVKKIHNLVADNTDSEDFEKGLIIVGDEKHPEVIGIAGWSKTNNIFYIKSIEDIDSIDLKKCKTYTIVVQTTFNNGKLNEIVEKLENFKVNYKLFNTICSATSERQDEVLKLAKNSDVMIVLGDKKSSNSNKLFEISKKYCKNSYLIETIHEIDLNILQKDVRIGLTAGASTPNAIIKEAINAMSDMDNMSFEQLLNESLTSITSGKYVTGQISQISSNGEVFVDLNNQYTGIIPRGEFSQDASTSVEKAAKVGDEIEVYVMNVSDIDGIATLSKRRADANKNFEVVEIAHNNNSTIRATITELVKGGAIAVVDGVRAFVPASQISHRFVRDLSSFVGNEYEFQIIELNRAKRKVVLSRKELAASEEASKLTEVYSKINVGDIVEGKVNRIVDFGAFIDINGIDGLVHISELSWSRVKKVTDILKVGETVKVKIIDIDKEKNKVSVSLKDLTQNPWDVAEAKYAVGTVIETKIARITNFGAFVNLEDGIDALIHISQISNKHVEKVENVLVIGQEVKAIVTEFDKENKKISLSMKELEPKAEEVDAE